MPAIGTVGQIIILYNKVNIGVDDSILIFSPTGVTIGGITGGGPYGSQGQEYLSYLCVSPTNWVDLGIGAT